jgi:hypothetical protein
MRTGSSSRAWRALTSVIILALCIGIAPGLLAPSRAAAQVDKLTQRQFDNLVQDAEAGDPVFGPEDGELEHDPDRVSLEPADLEVADFLATVTFQNPYAATRTQFDYGIQFRASGSGRNTQYLRFIVISDGTWGVTEGTENLIETGTYDNLDDTRSGENELTVYADGDTVHLGINGDYVASIEAPFDDPGDIAVGTSFLTESFREGAVTGFTDFTVWELGGKFGQTKKTPTPAEEETPTETPAVEGTTYESPTYGYSLTYDDTWTAQESSRRGTDTLELDNGTSGLRFDGVATDETPAECVNNLIDNLQSGDTVTDVTVAVDDNDDEMRGEIDNGEFAVLQITVEGDQGPAELTMYYSCLPIVEGESMLTISHVADSADYNDEIENRAAVLDTLSIGGESTGPNREPTAEPTAEGTASELPEGSVTFTLEATEQNGVFVFGTLVPNRNRTNVSVIILPVEARVDYVVTINSGTCRRPGSTEFSLGSADNVGLLDATVNATVEDLSSGDYIMVIADGGDMDAIIACGPLTPIDEQS